jgi:hypothetical protein
MGQFWRKTGRLRPIQRRFYAILLAILSLQSMITRNRGLNFSGAQIKRFRDEFIEKLFSARHLVFTAKRNIETIRFLDRIVGEIEQEVASQIKIKKEFIKLLTTPGIGNILGLIRLRRT